MPGDTIKVVVQSSKDNSWLTLVSVFAPIILVFIGWRVSFCSERKRLRTDIEVRATEEAINLLNEMTNSFDDIASPLVWLYNALKKELLNDIAINDIYSLSLNKFKTALETLPQKDKFSSYFESREIIFFDFTDRLKQLQEYKLNIADTCISLYEDMVKNYFTKSRSTCKLSQEDTLELMTKLKKVIQYFAKTQNSILNLKINLQNKFLSGFYKKRKISEVPLEETNKMYDMLIFNEGIEKVE